VIHRWLQYTLGAIPGAILATRPGWFWVEFGASRKSGELSAKELAAQAGCKQQPSG